MVNFFLVSAQKSFFHPLGVSSYTIGVEKKPSASESRKKLQYPLLQRRSHYSYKLQVANCKWQVSGHCVPIVLICKSVAKPIIPVRLCRIGRGTKSSAFGGGSPPNLSPSLMKRTTYIPVASGKLQVASFGALRADYLAASRQLPVSGRFAPVVIICCWDR